MQTAGSQATPQQHYWLPDPNASSLLLTSPFSEQCSFASSAQPSPATMRATTKPETGSIMPTAPQMYFPPYGGGGSAASFYTPRDHHHQQQQQQQNHQQQQLANFMHSTFGTTLPFSEAVERTTPRRPSKRRPRPVPEEKKDEAYKERRRKNNDSARRSREIRRRKEEQTQQLNLALQQEIQKLRDENRKLMVLVGHFTGGAGVGIGGGIGVGAGALGC